MAFRASLSAPLSDHKHHLQVYANGGFDALGDEAELEQVVNSPRAQVSGWGLYCYDFLVLPTASCCS